MSENSGKSLEERISLLEAKVAKLEKQLKDKASKQDVKRAVTQPKA